MHANVCVTKSDNEEIMLPQHQLLLKFLCSEMCQVAYLADLNHTVSFSVAAFQTILASLTFAQQLFHAQLRMVTLMQCACNHSA